MSISVFDLFKIGIGPSSSHTVGPMVAAAEFVQGLESSDLLTNTTRLSVTLHGSLSATGRGHGTDQAIVAGLAGGRPDTVDPQWVRDLFASVQQEDELLLQGNDQTHTVAFDLARDLTFNNKPLPFHPNAVTLVAYDRKYNLRHRTYYSVGGGFVVTEAEAKNSQRHWPDNLPHPFCSAKALLAKCESTGLRISDLMLANECSQQSEAEVRAGLHRLWIAMKLCIETGLKGQGILPGGLRVPRRAARFHTELQRAGSRNMIASSLGAIDWINLYALAVNEENASGGRMVTAPTNGAAGIIPAVLMYYLTFSEDVNQEDIVPFLLTAGAVGSLCKQNASISGAEVGCQGEVGSACAMAAAGLTEVLGGTPAQVENAAEIALEHNLGLTCDPIEGLVQVPCIERNAIAAVKAINAAQMALRGDGEHYVSLDKVIQTMRDTGRDMLDKYKETSLGGLAVNIPEC